QRVADAEVDLPRRDGRQHRGPALRLLRRDVETVLGEDPLVDAVLDRRRWGDREDADGHGREVALAGRLFGAAAARRTLAARGEEDPRGGERTERRDSGASDHAQ